MTTLKNILRITLPTLLVTLLVLELTFRYVIPASNPPLPWFDDEDQMYRFATDQGTGLATIGVFAQQQARWRINNAGWNSPIDYTEVKSKPRIAIIGDSYIESLQVDVDKHFPSMLRRFVGDKYDVYSFGISGAPLSEYLHIGRYAIERFDPDLIIFNVVHNDFGESVYRINHDDAHWLLISTDSRRIHETEPRAAPWTTQFSVLKQTLRNSALLRYLIFNLGVERLFRQGGIDYTRKYISNISPEEIARDRNAIRKAVHYVLERMQAEFRGREILFVLDAARDLVYSGSTNEQIEFLHTLMVGACRKAGFGLLDLTGPMRAAYGKNGRRFESELDWHWNEYGHAFVARAVAKMLQHRHFLSSTTPPVPPGTDTQSGRL